MKRISMLDFRLDSERILAQVQKGERMILTRRGKPVARLEPYVDEQSLSADPIYSLSDLAQARDSLGNPRIDEILYGR